MHRSSVFVFAACAAALFASGTTLAQKSSKQTGKDATYTGCVQQGKQAGTFMLTHVMAGETGNAQTSGKRRGRAPKMIHLESTSSARIAPDAGHKVTVMGSTMRSRGGPTMKVQSIKSISATCP